MNFRQQALCFTCEDERLLAIVSRPERPLARGLLIVVGGPQYRVGSHRQFALLANHLAQQGTPVMRFDYRGMGDSTGDHRDFEQVVDDLRAAADAFFGAVQELRELVIWGLCDAASAALFYAHRDARVSGIVLVNPWVRTVEGEAKAYLRNYYLQRVLSPAPWRKLLRGEFDLKGSLKALTGHISTASRSGGRSKTAGSLPERMADGLDRFEGRVLLILSGNDLVAKEFEDVASASAQWRRRLAAPRMTRYSLADATHTFSRREWRDQVAEWTGRWIRSW